MKDTIKNILKKLNLYYVIQGLYRNLLFYLFVLYNRIKYSKYKGHGYTCNFCNYQYKIFAPRYASVEDTPALEKYQVIGGDGENVYCPFCGSTCRERFVLQVLKERINCTNKKVLHLSPEKKIFDFLKTKSSVITADIEPGFYKLIDKNVLYADATTLPFENEMFDIVIANHVMEHIPDDSKAMREIFRVLKQNGNAIMQIPFSEIIDNTIEDPLISDPQKQSELFGQKDHVRIYNIKSYVRRLENAGFNVKYIKPEELNDWKKFAVQSREGFIQCIKNSKIQKADKFLMSSAF